MYKETEKVCEKCNAKFGRITSYYCSRSDCPTFVHTTLSTVKAVSHGEILSTLNETMKALKSLPPPPRDMQVGKEVFEYFEKNSVLKEKNKNTITDMVGLPILLNPYLDAKEWVVFDVNGKIIEREQ